MKMRILENNHNVTIVPLSGEYYAEYTTLYKPTYQQSGVLTLVYKIDTDLNEELIQKDLTIHIIDGQYQREVFDFPDKDGYYKVMSYIFPTKESLQELDLIDGVDDIKYNEYWRHYDQNNIIQNSTTEILAVDESSPSNVSCLIRKPNPVPYKKSGIYNWACFESLDDVIKILETREVNQGYVFGTNIQVVEEYYFKYNNLYKCLISKASDLLNMYRGCGNGTGICSDNNCKNNIDSQKVQIRDYIWMVLNAIKYAVECEDYITANNLLNCISTCNGICNNETVKKSSCGCS